MDPEETLKGALRALAGGDVQGAREYLGYYRDWREKDGFEPLNGDERAKAIDRLIRISPIR